MHSGGEAANGRTVRLRSVYLYHSARFALQFRVRLPNDAPPSQQVTTVSVLARGRIPLYIRTEWERSVQIGGGVGGRIGHISGYTGSVNCRRGWASWLPDERGELGRYTRKVCERT